MVDVIYIRDPLIKHLADLLFGQCTICTISHTSGSEGPDEDPYHYEEYVVIHKGKATTIHVGLANFITIGTVSKELVGYKVLNERTVMTLTSEMKFDDLANHFEQLTGIRVSCLSRYENRINRPYASKCKCGSRTFKSIGGFPGEHIQVCLKCGMFVDHTFDKSQII